jgi:hypothetical protein
VCAMMRSSTRAYPSTPLQPEDVGGHTNGDAREPEDEKPGLLRDKCGARAEGTATGQESHHGSPWWRAKMGCFASVLPP